MNIKKDITEHKEEDTVLVSPARKNLESTRLMFASKIAYARVKAACYAAVNA